MVREREREVVDYHIFLYGCIYVFTTACLCITCVYNNVSGYLVYLSMYRLQFNFQTIYSHTVYILPSKLLQVAIQLLGTVCA